MTQIGPIWAELTAEDMQRGWLSEVPTVSATDVLDALVSRDSKKSRRRPGHWLFVREIYAGPPFSNAQRFDALALGLTSSSGYLRIVYEVKISRSDWLRELQPRTSDRWEVVRDKAGRHKNPRRVKVPIPGNKWDRALEVAHELWYAAPPNCIAPAELPGGAGLLEVRWWGEARELRPRVIVPAARRDLPNPAPEFWAMILSSVAARRSPELVYLLA